MNFPSQSLGLKVVLTLSWLRLLKFWAWGGENVLSVARKSKLLVVYSLAIQLHSIGDKVKPPAASAKASLVGTNSDLKEGSIGKPEGRFGAPDEVTEVFRSGDKR